MSAQVSRDGRQSVGDVGEFGLIGALVERFPATAEVLLGPGDDAAVIAAPDGRVVASTDVLVEDVHFRRDWSSAVDIGVKAAAQNLSDIVAMGARPTALLLGLGVSADLTLGWVVDFADGFRIESSRAGAAIVGGDVVQSDRLTVSVTALGSLDGRAPITRAGARVGDVVALCGDVGLSAAGLAVLRRGFTSPREAVARHRRPVPNYSGAVGVPARSMIDISDGLVADAAHIAHASKVCLALDSTRVPVAEPVRNVAAALNIDVNELIFSGGEDHAFLATFAEGEVPSSFITVGTVLQAGQWPVLVDGQPWSRSGGHEHFA